MYPGSSIPGLPAAGLGVAAVSVGAASQINWMRPVSVGIGVGLILFGLLLAVRQRRRAGRT
jgi:hypothetical protein